MNERLRNVSSALDRLGPLVMNATDHARRLEEQANRLEKLLTDTSRLAEKAVNASRAYADLAKAIKEALVIAREAEKVASNAQNEVGELSQ